MSRAALVDNALLLAVWWALWTLADQYLIQFTPFSEAAVLVVVATLWAARTRWQLISAACSVMLTDATQTPMPTSAKSPRAYARQQGTESA